MSKRIRSALLALLIAIGTGAAGYPVQAARHTWLVCNLDGFEWWILIDAFGSTGAARQHCLNDLLGVPDRFEP